MSYDEQVVDRHFDTPQFCGSRISVKRTARAVREGGQTLKEKFTLGSRAGVARDRFVSYRGDWSVGWLFGSLQGISAAPA